MTTQAVWIEPEEVEVSEQLRRELGGHKLFLQTLARRGFSRLDQALPFLDPSIYKPTPAQSMPNVDLAVDRITRALQRGEHICVWGDFDVDGQTSTTVLVEALRDMGASVGYYIPLRETESHGVHLPALRELIDAGIDLLITCDTGVHAHEAISFAQARGVDVIVTDHHDLPPRLPDAYAVINPKMLKDIHPLHSLPGVGVAYKLVEALAFRLGREEQLSRSLDLVALGIVADLAALRADVRYLLQRGLEVLRSTPRLGLQALIQLAGLKPEMLSEEHIGYMLGPRLNAVGRLADANVMVDFLTTDDPVHAKILANELEGLNLRRKYLCDQVLQAASTRIETERPLADVPVLVLAHAGWPAGVLGIVAGRLAQRYHRPAILLTVTPQGLARGSARSIEGVDISSAIAAQSDLLLGFGGHPMAAGLSIEAARIPEFEQALSQKVEQLLGEVDARPHVQVDGYVELAELTLDFVTQLERLGPFGPGNPNPTLAARALHIESIREIGRSGEHRLLMLADQNGVAHKVLWWNAIDWSLPEGAFDLAFYVRASDFQGQREVQVSWIDARPLDPARPPQFRKPRALEVMDHRHITQPETLLAELERQGLQVWSEGQFSQRDGVKDRYQLRPAEALAIWTPPPGLEELQAVLQQVKPHTVHIFSQDPGFSQPEVLLRHLAGMIKYAFRTSEGRIRLSRLAAATAHRELTVRKGVEWLVVRGDVEVLRDGLDEMILTRGSGGQGAGKRILQELNVLVAETVSFRKFFLRADLKNLLDL